MKNDLIRHAHELQWKHIYQINPLQQKELAWLSLNSGCEYLDYPV